MINIVEILKRRDCNNLHLWNNITGVCILSTITKAGIITDTFTYSEFGEYKFNSGLCNLFPAKDLTWADVNLQKGDILYYTKDNSYVTFKGFIGNDYYTFNGTNYLKNGEKNRETIFYTKDFKKLTDITYIDEYKRYFKPNAVLVDTTKFKPYDKVLCRNSEFAVWQLSLFAHYNSQYPTDSQYPYVCVNGIHYKQVIPFEDNEHLLDTRKPK